MEHFLRGLFLFFHFPQPQNSCRGGSIRSWSEASRCSTPWHRPNVMQSGDLKACHELARRIVAREPQFENVQLLGPKGEHLVNARLPYEAALPRLNGPELPMRAAMLGQPVVSDAEMAVVAKRVLTVIYVPVVKDGKISHVVGAAIEPPNWTEVLRSVLPMGVDALLLDRSHFVITSTPGVPQAAAAGTMQDVPAPTAPAIC